MNLMDAFRSSHLYYFIKERCTRSKEPWLQALAPTNLLGDLKEVMCLSRPLYSTSNCIAGGNTNCPPRAAWLWPHWGWYLQRLISASFNVCYCNIFYFPDLQQPFLPSFSSSQVFTRCFPGTRHCANYRYAGGAGGTPGPRPPCADSQVRGTESSY